MHLAAASGMIGTCKLLVEKGYNLRENNGLYENSPLHLAARRKKIEIIHYLVENGANVDAQNADGYTSLFVACKESDFATAQALCLLKADPNIKPFINGKRTPLLACNVFSRNLVIRQ